MPEQSYSDRQTAIKIKIKEINEGRYIIEEGWKPNYLLTKKKEKISRANLIGAVLDKKENGAMTDLILDDGSGRIVVRSFEKSKNFDEIKIGEGVLVIGKVREFNQEKYLSPEIVKKKDKKWLKVRALELEKMEEKEADEEEKKEEPLDLTRQKIIELIRRLDKGEGAMIEEVKEKSTLNNTGELIEKMLKNGEIFQNLPGRIKVL